MSLFASEDQLRQSEPVLKQINPPEGVGNRTAIDVYEVAAGWTNRARPSGATASRHKERRGRAAAGDRYQAEAAARPRLRSTPTRVSRRMAGSSDRRARASVLRTSRPVNSGQWSIAPS
jgi:hypothetical protein